MNPGFGTAPAIGIITLDVDGGALDSSYVTGGDLTSGTIWDFTPVAGLSPANVDKLLAIVMSLKERYGLTILIVEHILKVVMDTCDQVTVLDHGEKIGEGTPNEVKNDHAVIEAYLGQEMDDEEIRAAFDA